MQRAPEQLFDLLQRDSVLGAFVAVPLIPVEPCDLLQHCSLGQQPTCAALLGASVRSCHPRALLGIVPPVTIADQRAATKTVSSVADVSLSDLNLSTPEGMHLARDRLHTTAERLCADRGGGRAVGH